MIADDASALFNFLTGYSQGHEWQKLVVAPSDLHRRTIELIDEQTERARAGQDVADLRQAQLAGRPPQRSRRCTAPARPACRSIW